MHGQFKEWVVLVSTSTMSSWAPFPLPLSVTWWMTKLNVAARYITSKSSFTSLKLSFCRSFKVASLKLNAIVSTFYRIWSFRSGPLMFHYYL